YAVDGGLVLRVHDQFCPWNDGQFELNGGPGGAEARRTTASPDLELDVAELGAVYLSGNRFRALQQARQIKELRPDSVARADAMFATDRAPWCPNDFKERRSRDNPCVDRETCLSFDQQDPLAAVREEFVVPDGVIYLDGNSLGALPRRTVPRLNQVIADEWGNGLIRSWNSAHWIEAPVRIGDKIAGLIGARPGEVLV